MKACGIDIVLDKIRIANVPTAEQLQDITAKVKGLIG